MGVAPTTSPSEGLFNLRPSATDPFVAIPPGALSGLGAGGSRSVKWVPFHSADRSERCQACGRVIAWEEDQCVSVA